MQTDPNAGQTRKHTYRLSHHAIQILNAWMREHRDHPYPAKSEKAALQRSTGLTAHQMDTWFANARRRRKAKVTPQNHVNTTASAVGSGTSSSDVSLSLASDTPQTSSECATPVETCTIESKRNFHCTFCPDSFKSKFDWTRHETSVHLSLQRCFCCPFSPIETSTETGLGTCAYCRLAESTNGHIASHDHGACQSRPPEARIFSRKDHLRQHLRFVHECEFLPHMNTWLLQAKYVNSRCGFCGERFTDWSSRNAHIAAHFRQGSQMRSWRGCRGLDSAVSAQVIAAMPSYLIGCQPRSHETTLICKSSKLEHNINSDLSISKWDLLTRELMAFVVRYSSQGVTASDEALRQQARMITYGSATALNETAADHPEWLDTFKRAYCLAALPGLKSAQTTYDPEDLDVHHDLGLTMPYLQCQRAKALHILFLHRGPMPKSGRRFSSLIVPIHKALPFETIAGPWPDAGIIGETIIIRDQLFSSVVKAQMNWTLGME